MLSLGLGIGLCLAVGVSSQTTFHLDEYVTDSCGRIPMYTSSCGGPDYARRRLSCSHFLLIGGWTSARGILAAREGKPVRITALATKAVRLVFLSIVARHRVATLALITLLALALNMDLACVYAAVPILLGCRLRAIPRSAGFAQGPIRRT